MFGVGLSVFAVPVPWGLLGACRFGCVWCRGGWRGVFDCIGLSGVIISYHTYFFLLLIRNVDRDYLWFFFFFFLFNID